VATPSASPTTPEQVAAAQRPRHDVFAGELGAHLPGAVDGRDVDEFDPFCDHLIVRDDATGAVVGTYRMLPPKAAERAGRRYADGEFEMGGLCPLRDQLVETGRSCVHPDHRDGAVVNLMWAGIARYLHLNNLRWLGGCASVPLDDGGMLAAGTWARVSGRHLSPPALRVRPRTPWLSADTPAGDPETALPPPLGVGARCLSGVTENFQLLCSLGAAAGRKMVGMAAQTQPKQSEAKLLVVEDDANILELLSASLRFAGFDVSTATSGSAAVSAAKNANPDLVVLDVMLPDLDGFEVIRLMREGGARTPVVFLTARDGTDDKIRGLTLGGDDYVTKPFSLEELTARIRAVLRRTTAGDEAPARLTFADLELDEETHEVYRAGQRVQLSPTEFKLLRYLMLNANRVLSKAQILDHVWKYDFRGDDNIVESYISYLRRKVDNVQPRLIHTLRGVGYVLRKPAA
jgi:two-component system OmpR family response regulator